MKVGTLPVVVSLAVTPLLLVRSAAAPGFSAWSDPVHLDPPINTTFNETAPSLSKDGLALYFSSSRPCGEGDTVVDLNIWVAHRATKVAPPMMASMQRSNGATSLASPAGRLRCWFKSAVAENWPLVKP